MRVCLLISALLFLVSNHAAAEVFRCFNAEGKPFYTDNKVKCGEYEGKKQVKDIEELQVKNYNLHSQYGDFVSEEHYNYAFREYVPLSGYPVTIIAEKKLHQEHPKTLNSAAKKLSDTAERACKIFTKFICAQFSDLKYFIFTGDESRTGGRHGGQWYFRKGNRTAEKFDHSIVVRSASDYLRYTDDGALMTEIHELSHAYYYLHFARLYRSNLNAYKNAMTKNLYRQVENSWGTQIEKAYALTNEREYFAELAKIYWLHNDYYPFTREDLRAYDPEGYLMISQAFILQ